MSTGCEPYMTVNPAPSPALHRLVVAGVWCVGLVLSGCASTLGESQESDQLMNPTMNLAQQDGTLSLDSTIPSHTETATFALG